MKITIKRDDLIRSKGNPELGEHISPLSDSQKEDINVILGEIIAEKFIQIKENEK